MKTLLMIILMGLVSAILYFFIFISKPSDLVPFRDIASDAGIQAANISGTSERHFIFESIGNGGALFDFDGDGLLDVLLLHGGTLLKSPKLQMVPGPGAFLYRQVSRGRFENVSATSGIQFEGWGSGVAVGDVDNDGDLDVLITVALGPNRFFINQGKGDYIERSVDAGLNHTGFGTSAVFLDYDRDGFLDLYVANYVEFDFDKPPNDGKPCLEEKTTIACGPTAHTPALDILYRNLGNGRFEDVTTKAGMANQEGAYGLGVAAGDLNRDGWPDLYVANDTSGNFLWLNRGDGTFTEEALYSGAALSENAQGQAGMGVDLADVSRDGWLDIIVTNYAEEPNAYYQSLGDGTFSDRSSLSGLGRAAYNYLGWGTKFLDYNLDGVMDLVVVNGHVHPRAADLRHGASFEQRCLLFEGWTPGSFKKTTGASGGGLNKPRNHRGLSVGDFDNDGDPDLLITLLHGPPCLLENQTTKKGRAIAFSLEGSPSNREGVGARVEIKVGGQLLIKEVTRGGGFLSSSDGVVYFGVGDQEKIENLRVSWPSGKEHDLGPLKTSAHYRIREADGVVSVIRGYD